MHYLCISPMFPPYLTASLTLSGLGLFYSRSLFNSAQLAGQPCQPTETRPLKAGRLLGENWVTAVVVWECIAVISFYFIQFCCITFRNVGGLLFCSLKMCHDTYFLLSLEYP